MIICLCNRVRENDLQDALEEGACSVGQAFRCLGCAPVCGKCVPYIRECIGERRENTVH